MDGWVEWGFITVARMMEGSLPSLVLVCYSGKNLCVF